MHDTGNTASSNFSFSSDLTNTKWKNILQATREKPYFCLKFLFFIICITKPLIGDAENIYLGSKVELKWLERS